MLKQFMKHRREIAAALAAGKYEVTDGGLLIKAGIDALATGVYVHSVNGGQDLREDPNLLPDEGILHMLNVTFGATAKVPNWYLALFANQINPAPNWTAANFAATAGEITSSTEGYSNSTRPAFTSSPAAAGQITNLAAKAAFNIVCTTSLNVEGAAMLSNSGKGSGAGVLASASRYSATRTLYNGDVYEVGYGVSLSA